MDYMDLVQNAIAARANAYAPYSDFAVGAALLCADGTVFTGCNVENVSFGVTNCAERSALFAAVSAGHRRFSAIAVVGGKRGEAITKTCPPCGICRQALCEFCDEAFPVILYDGRAVTQTTLGALLPTSFASL